MNDHRSSLLRGGNNRLVVHFSINDNSSSHNTFLSEDNRDRYKDRSLNFGLFYNPSLSKQNDWPGPKDMKQDRRNYIPCPGKDKGRAKTEETNQKKVNQDLD